MLTKKEIKDIQSLSRKKFRDELKLFLAEGPKIVKELALLIPGKIDHIYATEEWINEYKDLQNTIQVTAIKDFELEKISQLQTPNQALALIRQLDSEVPDAVSFTLYLDGIQDPGNFGTIIRLADWFGIKDVVCGPGCADPYNPKVVQSTMASIARVNIYEDKMDEWLKKQEVPVYAATLHGRSLYEHSRVSKGILVIGNESKGIRQEIISLAKNEITIPKKGGAECLNAAIATGIILSHIMA